MPRDVSLNVTNSNKITHLWIINSGEVVRGWIPLALVRFWELRRTFFIFLQRTTLSHLWNNSIAYRPLSNSVDLFTFPAASRFHHLLPTATLLLLHDMVVCGYRPTTFLPFVHNPSKTSLHFSRITPGRPSSGSLSTTTTLDPFHSVLIIQIPFLQSDRQFFLFHQTSFL